MCIRFRIAPDKEVRVPTVVIGLIMLLWASGPAAGTPPSPIAAGDLELFARRLDLSGEQRQAMDEYYMAYLQRYWQSGVGSAPQDSRAARLAKLPDEIPDLAAIRAVLKDRQRALTSMGRLDESFFMSLQDILTELQLQQMTRVRSLRERTLLMQDEQVSEWYGQGQHLDLGLIIDDLEMTFEQREKAFPSIEAYERNLTQLLRRLWKKSGEMRTDWRRLLDREDVDPKEVWIEVAREVRPIALEAAAHNRRWVERIAAVLPEETAVILRYKFDVSPFYTMLGYAEPAALAFFARSLDDLTDDQRERIQAIYEKTTVDRKRLHNQLCEMDEERRIDDRTLGSMRASLFEGSPEERNAWRKRFNDLINKTLRDGSAIWKEIETLVGKTHKAKLRQRVMTYRRSTVQTNLGFAKRKATRQRSVASMRGFAPPESYLYPPLTETDFDLLADLLQLLPQARETFLIALREYHDAFQDLQRQYTQPLDELRLGNFPRPIAENSTRLSHQYSPPEDVYKGFDLMDHYIEKVSVLERSLKGKFLSMVPEDRQDAAEALWQCRVITARPTPKENFYEVRLNDYMLALRTDVTQTDPIAPLESLDLTIGEREAILAVIVEEAEIFHRAATTHHKKSLEAWKFFAEGICRMRAGNNQDREHNERFIAQYPMKEAEVLRTRHELIQDALRLSNRLAEALGDTNAQIYLQGYRRRAFPVVTYDPTSLLDRFKAALLREELSNQQRTSLAQNRADYDSLYQRMARQLIDLDLEWEDAYARGERGEGDRQRLEQAIDQLRFEREALNYVYGKKLENALEALAP